MQPLSEQQVEIALGKPAKARTPVSAETGRQAYPADFDAEVLAYLDDGNAPWRQPGYHYDRDAPLWPPAEGAGWWARHIRFVRLTGGSDKAEETAALISIRDHTRSADLREVVLRCLRGRALDPNPVLSEEK